MPVKIMARPGGIGGADDFIVLDGAAGLDDGGGAGLRAPAASHQQRKERIGGHNGAVDKRQRVSCRPGRILAFAHRDTGRIDA